ncbi:class I SAM-dependent methyltransferase [bacterium]|nr:class I SAM-dependent methyltransferase [bacterium]
MEKIQEFDRYAHSYSGGNEDPLKRLFGENLDQFIYVKAKWLWNYLVQNQEKKLPNKGYHLLDYGCGTGEMLKWLKIFGFPGHLHGADVSQAMLDEAEKRWDTFQKPIFSCIDKTKTNFDNNSFDYIVATCVFHHIEPNLRDDVLQEIKRILVPGGKLIIFEHNPFNPMTRFIVKRAAIDKNAVFLYPKEIRFRFQKTMLLIHRLDYLMFFPPSIKFFQRFEKYLGRFPLGAQYVVVGKKCVNEPQNKRYGLKIG